MNKINHTEGYMNISTELLYRIYIILLGSGILLLTLRYFYLKTYSPKNLFQKNISYVEIRAWREKQ